MKDENAFNAYLGKQFRALHGTASLKANERHHIGIADFILWRGGRSVGLEVKFIKELPAKGSVLTHAFSGAQQTFLRTLMRAGVPAFGLIACDLLRRMWLIPADTIPENGNWASRDFHAMRLEEFGFAGGDGLVDAMFAHHMEDGRCRR